MSKILIVEDEIAIAELEKDYLELSGFEVEVEAQGEVGLLRALKEEFDLIILDLMLPGVDGFEICRKIRETKNTPIIIVSAKKDDIDKIRGLGMGADDYMTKPFNPLEAIARVNSNIRRFYSLGTSSVTEVIKVRDLELDIDACEFRKNGEVIELTSVEYKIMELFMKSPGKVFTKQQIYEYGWGEDFIVADNNIMVCISKLRDKLDEDPSAYIKTIRGLGYRLER